jgi:hypothetical protein
VFTFNQLRGDTDATSPRPYLGSQVTKAGPCSGAVLGLCRPAPLADEALCGPFLRRAWYGGGLPPLPTLRVRTSDEYQGHR